MENTKSGFTPFRDGKSKRGLTLNRTVVAEEKTKLSPIGYVRHCHSGELSLTGFTLLELLTVVAIISLLAAMIFPNLGKVRVRARIAKVVAELKTIELALMEYYSEHGGFPTNDTSPVKKGLYKLFEEDLLETALQDAFLDAPYEYYSCVDDVATADSCIVFSVGSDGVDNGATNFPGALADAYPGLGDLPPDLEKMPTSDNIYLFVGANMARTDPLFGRESDIRYKK